MTTGKAPLLTFEHHGMIVVGTIREARMLDALNVADFGQQLADFVAGQQGLRLLLSFEHVDYLSSAVLTELLRANGTVREGDGKICLWGLSPAIREVFEITNLEKVFTIYRTDTCDEAVSRFDRSLDVEAQEEGWRRLKPDES